MAQSTALRVGNAYLSSGGVYAHLATYEWYDGTSWHNPTSTAGLMFQLNGATNVNIYYHDGAQAHTLWATCASTAGWTAGSSKTYKQNIKTLTDSDYASLRKQFQSIPMFSYNRKDAPKEQEVGFISEYAPDLVVSGSDKTQITLLKAIGYLAAIGKGQENAIEEQQSQIDALKQEISQLKTKLNSRRGQ